ncbi:crossover junction endonuclease MUS81 [Linnemannia elongata]|nr:crossover junction endonuclease MUS81 [Linnemannia elongata]
MIQCGNPLWLSWLEEWMDIAQTHGNKSYHTFRRAAESMAKYPTPFHHPREAMVLEGIGEAIAKKLEERLARHCREEGIPMPVYGKKGRRQAGAVPLTPVEQDEPKPKKPRKTSAKPYVPKYRSGSFAILLALLEAEVQHNRRSLTRDEILVTGQKFAEHSLANKAHGTFYSGWDSMKTLTGKGLVYQNGKDYHMTGEGRDTAWQLRDVGLALDPSLEQYFVRPNGGSAVNPNIRGGPPTYQTGDEPVNANIRDRPLSYSFESPRVTPTQTLNTFSTVTGDDGPTVDIAQLAKFQPIYYKPGSFDITLVLDVREVRVQGDRDYISNKLREKGVDVETRTLDIGDVIWIAKPKEPSPLLPKEVVLDHIVERKRMDDLVSSIKDGRFNEQKFRLSRSGIGQVVYLLETYKTNETFGGFPAEAIRTAITATQVHSGFFVKRTINTDQTIDYLVALTKALKAKYLDQVLYTIPDTVIDRDGHLDLIEYLKGKFPGRTYLTSYDAFMKLNSKSDTLTVRDNFVKMLMVIRGVSNEKAIELARVYGTPRAMFSALAELRRDASKDERRDVLAKSVSQIGRKKLGNALAGKIAKLWYSQEYDDPAAPPKPTYGS